MNFFWQFNAPKWRDRGLIYGQNLHQIGFTRFAMRAAHGEQDVISASQVTTVHQKFNGARLEVLRCKGGEVKEKRKHDASQRQTLQRIGIAAQGEDGEA